MPRFITRTHPLSEAPLRWATGVVLRDQGARVLVRADASEREVHVVALGEEVARKSLIGVVRADFMQIHSQLKGLTVHEELERTPGVWLQVRTLEADERHHSDSSAATPQGSIRFPPSVELNRVSHPAARDAGAWRARVFISYSSRDARLKDELLIRLKPLQATEGLISVWHDRCLTAGEAWDRRIREEIDQAHLILLLVSASFLGSDYIRDIEMLRALERHRRGAARVIPIILERCEWHTQLGDLQALPSTARPIRDWKPQCNGWHEVALALREALEALRIQDSSPARAGQPPPFEKLRRTVPEPLYEQVASR